MSCSRCCLAKSSGVIPRLAASAAIACCICCMAATCCGDGWRGSAILCGVFGLGVEGGGRVSSGWMMGGREVNQKKGLWRSGQFGV